MWRTSHPGRAGVNRVGPTRGPLPGHASSSFASRGSGFESPQLGQVVGRGTRPTNANPKGWPKRKNSATGNLAKVPEPSVAQESEVDMRPHWPYASGGDRQHRASLAGLDGRPAVADQGDGLHQPVAGTAVFGRAPGRDACDTRTPTRHKLPKPGTTRSVTRHVRSRNQGGQCPARHGSSWLASAPTCRTGLRESTFPVLFCLDMTPFPRERWFRLSGKAAGQGG